ncbi:MAG TPA: ADYC domain-containing protein, partial [Myxococcales bacterium]|nr:ADYC domain-containing protein [Myxococcales bacterium]
MRQLIFTWTVLVAMILAGAGFEARAQDQWNRPPIQGGQGTQLHGTGEYEHVNLKLEGRRYNKAGTKWSDCAVSLEKGVLRSRCDLDGNPAGVTFIAAHQGGIAYFTVLEAKAGADAAAGQYQYKVAVSASPPGSPGSPEPQPLCGAYALAVPYAWSTSGELLADEKEGAHYFTFACPGGVIAKCISWGYVPWATGAKGTSAIDGAPLLYDDPTAQRFHQTCVRLASADYCGEGNSNTVDGTPVGITNIANTLATKTGGAMTLASGPLPDQFRLTAGTEPLGPADAPELEGVWGFDHCGRARVLCLGRERWDTLSLAATCTDGVMARRLVAAPPPYSTDCAQAVAKRAKSIQVFRCRGRRSVFESEAACKGQCGQGCLREQLEFESDLVMPLPPGRDRRPAAPLAGTAPGTCGPPPPPKLCDQWTVEDLKNEGATLFSYSSRWTK